MELYSSIVDLKSQPIPLLIIFSLGSLTLLKLSISFLNWVYINFLRPPKNLNKYVSWALVTGSTDGISKGFAFQLARKCLNLVLVGRNPTMLTEVSDSIKVKFGKTQIKIVVVDFSDNLDEGVERIKEAIDGLDVGVLINNVGVGDSFWVCHVGGISRRSSRNDAIALSLGVLGETIG